MHISFISPGHRQNTVHMHVALRREAHDRAVPAARHDDRAFGLERQQLFKHAGHLLQVAPCSRQLGRIFDAHLALAVVAHARRFQNAWQQICGHGLALRECFDDRVGRAGHARHHTRFSGAGREMGFLLNPVLRNGHGSSAGRYRALGRQRQQRGGRHVFEFSGNGRAQRCQLQQTLLIVESSLDMVMADPASGTLRIRVEHRREVAQTLRGMHKHAAELAAAHHAQRGRLARCGYGSWEDWRH